MTAEITWPVGRTLAEVAQRECSWCFAFSGGGRVVTESAWRLLTIEGVSVTSEDHGQVFGLKLPVDAISRLLAATKEKKIQESRIVGGSSDLMLKFEDGVRLEFLNLSCGFEAWRATFGSEDVICLGGGALWKNAKLG